MKFWKKIKVGNSYINKTTGEIVQVYSKGWFSNNTIFPYIVIVHKNNKSLRWLSKISRIEFINTYNELV